MYLPLISHLLFSGQICFLCVWTGFCKKIIVSADLTSVASAVIQTSVMASDLSGNETQHEIIYLNWSFTYNLTQCSQISWQCGKWFGNSLDLIASRCVVWVKMKLIMITLFPFWANFCTLDDFPCSWFYFLLYLFLSSENHCCCIFLLINEQTIQTYN